MFKNYFSNLSHAYLIAEIGVNHNGDLKLALDMVKAAKKSGANAVKFQTFSAKKLVLHNTPKVDYQKNTTDSKESHYEMLQRLELGESEHIEIFNLCSEIGIDFLSTPYDIDSARFLDGLGIKFFKTASADLVDLPLQEFIASTGKPSIVATGMASLDEIETVVDLYKKYNNYDLILLHCVSNYPCADSSLNLNAMDSIFKKFNFPIGYSDHSLGFLASCIAVTKGAKIIEKHFTLDKCMQGPDHKASSTPEEFLELVKNVRRTETILGTSLKICQEEEKEMAKISRKSIVLANEISAGKKISLSNLIMMRPGDGIPAKYISRIVGRRTRTDLPALHQLNWEDLEEN